MKKSAIIILIIAYVAGVGCPIRFIIPAYAPLVWSFWMGMKKGGVKESTSCNEDRERGGERAKAWIVWERRDLKAKQR